MKTLDRTKDYTSVCGDDQGRVFEQDGVFFRGDGSQWGVTAKAEKPAPVEVVEDQVDSQLEQVEEQPAEPEAKKPAAKKAAAKKPAKGKK